MSRQFIRILPLIFAFFALLGFALYQFVRHETKSNTAIVINKTSFSHTKPGHPESHLRLTSIIKFLEHSNLLSKVHILPERVATKEEVLLVHENDYFEKVLAESHSGFYSNDKWSPYITESSLQSALTAVGSLIDLSEAIARGDYSNGFSIVRPPGHHATKNRAMGYCIFNNIAVATKNLIKKGLAKRVLIVDTDAHFGNGIAEIFENNRQVYYLSLNQKWVFPYSKGESSSNIKDIKIDFLTPEDEHLRKFKEAVSLAMNEFEPDFIFVSAGYDGHWRDYMSNLSLSLSAYAEMSRFLVELSKKTAAGKIVFSLEGGYDLDVLPVAVSNSIKALMNSSDFEDPIGKVNESK